MKSSNLKYFLTILLMLVIYISLLPVAATACYSSDQRWIDGNVFNIFKSSIILTPVISSKPVITTYPASKTIVEGKTAKFGVKVTGEALSYQWQYRTSTNGTWRNSNAIGSKTELISFTANVGQDGYQYRCKITNSAGSVYTSAATLTVVTEPTITTHPASKTITVGNTAKFGVIASGGGLKYQWQYRTGQNEIWKNSRAIGNETRTMAFTVASNQNGYQYRCKITNKAGTVYTKVATLTVKEVKLLDVASGKSGLLNWILDNNGKLTFSGQGCMEDYNDSSIPPWYESRELIQTILLEDGVESIGNYAFQDCSRLTSVTIPNSVTYVGESAFEGCSRLIDVSIPNSVTSVGEWAFYNCSSLKSVIISNSLTSILKGTFNGCISLINVKIPNGITNIQRGAFYDCSGLILVTIPNSVTNIESWAFYNCTNLTSLTIPQSVRKIDRSAFGGCSGLQTISFFGAFPNIEASAFRYVTATVYYPPDHGWTDNDKKNYGGTLTWSVITKPVVTTHPSSKTVEERDTVKFGVIANGVGLSYQWQYRSGPDEIWVNSSAVGNRTKKISLTGTSTKNGYQYRCRITNIAGTVYTNAAILTVNTPKIITTQPISSSVANGNTVKFGITASGEDLFYQWEYRTSSSGTWTKSNAPGNNTNQIMFIAKNSQNGYQYRCRVTNSTGSVYTKSATLTVN